MENKTKKTTLEKFNDISLQENKIFRKKEKLKEKLLSETVGDIASRIRKHPGERVALTISGTYEYTQTYGSRSNKTSSESFHIRLVGRLSKNSTIKRNIPTDKKFLYGHNEYEINVDKLFTSSYPMIDKMIEVHGEAKKIILEHRCKEAPTWSIEDFIASSLDEKVWRKIFPFELNKRTVNIHIFIGNEEFDKFLSTRNEYEINVIKKLNIWY